MDKQREKLTLFLALSFLVFQLVTGKALFIVTFAPFLILLFRLSSLIRTLFISLLCGLLIDLLVSTSFGLFTVVYTLTSFLLYSQRNFLYEDRPISFFLFTTLYSFLFAILTLVFLTILEAGFPISGSFVIVDLLLYPLVDGCYALLWFTIPLYYIKKRGKRA